MLSDPSSVEAKAPLVSVRDLEMAFPIRQGTFFRRKTGELHAVDGVSFDIRPGETLGLVGESGSGKSTVGRALIGIDQPTGGTVHFQGREITASAGISRRRLAERMQMIFQDNYASIDPRMKVTDIIAEPLKIHNRGNRSDRKTRALELLSLVGLPQRFAGAFPHQLSGGQRQRVGIARALALEPQFVICDEAVSALDVSIQAQIINLLLDLQDRLGLTYLFIAHDIAIVRQVSHWVMVMYRGQIMEQADSDGLIAEPLHPYTRVLMDSAPVPDPALERKRRAGVPTSVNDLADSVSTGCPFAPRCPRAAEASAKHGIDCFRVKPRPVAPRRNRMVACHLYGGASP